MLGEVYPTLHFASLSPYRHTFRGDTTQPPGYTAHRPELTAGQQPRTRLTALEHSLTVLTFRQTVIYRHGVLPSLLFASLLFIPLMSEEALPAPWGRRFCVMLTRVLAMMHNRDPECRQCAHLSSRCETQVGVHLQL